jgi:hypothetical protein
VLLLILTCFSFFLLPAVALVEPDYKVHVQWTQPDDTNIGLQWHHPKVGSEAAWDTSTGSAVVKVRPCVPHICLPQAGLQKFHGRKLMWAGRERSRGCRRQQCKRRAPAPASSAG